MSKQTTQTETKTEGAVKRETVNTALRSENWKALMLGRVIQHLGGCG